ncbi:MAG: UDP-4-amino-4,6-dideoxy-N-acetyl-beta-L-altrosamine N-acetyltransferase [candidate division Zixibacteria bacterium]
MMHWHDKYLFRPIERRDLELVLKWRNSDRIRENMYTSHVISFDEHLKWFEKISTENKTLHFIFEVDNIPLGVVNITNIDNDNKKCVWGFYIGAENAPQGCGSAMGFFALEHLFEKLGFHRVVGEAFAFNADSVKYHKRLGFIEEGVFYDYVIKDEKYEDIVTLAILEDRWREIKPSLIKKFFERDG